MAWLLMAVDYGGGPGGRALDRRRHRSRENVDLAGARLPARSPALQRRPPDVRPPAARARAAGRALGPASAGARRALPRVFVRPLRVGARRPPRAPRGTRRDRRGAI